MTLRLREYGNRMSQREIRALTGLRGVAACWVVLRHTHQEDIFSSLWSRLIVHGYLAVDLFFILSGFVMALSYQHLFAKGLTIRAYGVFLGRRLARIWPLYAVAVICYSILFIVSFKLGVVLHGITSDNIRYLFPINLALIQSWGLGESINGPSWSISTEFAAYVLFPILVSLTLLSQPRMATSTGVVAVLTIVLLPYFAGVSYQTIRLLDFTDGRTIWPIVRCISEFILGALTFRIAIKPSIPASLMSPVASIVVAFAMFFLAGTNHADIVFVLLAPVLILQLSSDKGPIAKVLGSRPVHFIGVMSYGIYLIHYALLRLHSVKIILSPVVGDIIASLLADFCVLSVSTAAAFVAHHLIELPGRSRINQFVARLERKTTQATKESSGSASAK